jgi:hypothetical protein
MDSSIEREFQARGPTREFGKEIAGVDENEVAGGDAGHAPEQTWYPEGPLAVRQAFPDGMGVGDVERDIVVAPKGLSLEPRGQEEAETQRDEGAGGP